MSPFRIAAVTLLGLALVACDNAQDAAPATIETTLGDEQGAATTTAGAPLPTAEDFLAGLALDFPHQVTSHRQVRQKGGGSADVFAIDYTEGSVRTTDQKLAASLRAAGFDRGDRTTVPGGIRVAYEADDGRRVSTMIRNKKYLGDRIEPTSAGQISLSYVPR